MQGLFSFSAPGEPSMSMLKLLLAAVPVFGLAAQAPRDTVAVAVVIREPFDFRFTP